MVDIAVDKLTFAYPGQSRPALREVSLRLPASSLALLCGASGCGKTTLLRCLKRELLPHGKRQGQVRIGGILQEKLSPISAAATVGLVMQQPQEQVVCDTVEQELCFGLENLGTPPAVLRRRVAEMAGYFGLCEWLHKEVRTLSGGQLQLLNLAAVMAMQPQLLLLDEPTAQLDPVAAREFLLAVQRVNVELGTTVLLCEHRLEEALPLADRVLYLRDGALSFCGDSRGFVDFLANEEQGRQQLPPIPRLVCAIGGPKAAAVPLDVRQGRTWLRQLPAIKEGAHTDAKADAPPAKAPPKDALLRATGLWYAYRRGGPFALRDLDLAVYPGEVHCLLGGNGSGKSTALAALAGARRPDRGKVRRPPDVRTGLLVQQPKALLVCDTVREELAEGLSGDDLAQLRALAQRLGLCPLLDRHPYDVSAGELQRVALGKLLLRMRQGRRVLLLDEPTKGLDAPAKATIAALLRDLAAEGAGILLATHDLEFAAQHAHRCTMLLAGQAVCEEAGAAFFVGNAVYTTDIHRMTRGLLEGCVTVEDALARLLPRPPHS